MLGNGRLEVAKHGMIVAMVLGVNRGKISRQPHWRVASNPLIGRRHVDPVLVDPVLLASSIVKFFTKIPGKPDIRQLAGNNLREEKGDRLSVCYYLRVALQSP